MDRPIRVVVLAGGLDSAVLRLGVGLDRHDDVDLLAGFCRARGVGVRRRIADSMLRRGLSRLPLLFLPARDTVVRSLLHPREESEFRQGIAGILHRFEIVQDLNAATIVERVCSLLPDLAILHDAGEVRAELLAAPRRGALAVHHGRLPEYRGCMPTFWEMYNGEAAAGVTIVRASQGIEAGPIVREGVVPIGDRSYGRVLGEVQELAARLCVEAVLAVKDGDETPVPQRVAQGRVYASPSVRERARLWWRGFMDLP